METFDCYLGESMSACAPTETFFGVKFILVGGLENELNISYGDYIRDSPCLEVLTVPTVPLPSWENRSGDKRLLSGD